MAEILIVPVTTPAELNRFIRLPMRLNADDPKYIAPLIMERQEALSAKVNPFFAHADVQFWLAMRGGVDVGRISAQVDHLASQDPARPVGAFGLIAAEDDVVNPLGVKGVGEIGQVGVAAAIGNAVHHATGRRVRKLPITIEDLL